ncbi:MAG TPA: ABC transporter substrate-binding protein [Albitalea sp.]|nr:ABC transporter substrate-binding protein [Albitalea sp.]
MRARPSRQPLRALGLASLLAAGTPAWAQVLVGQTTGVTGISAAAVKETGAGAALWIDAVNAKGGVNGQRIEVITLDDKSEPALAAANARTLIEQRKVVALFLTRGTPTNEAILPVLDEHGVALIGPSTGAMVLHKPVQPHVFNVRTPYQVEAERAIAQLASMGISRIGVLQTDDSFGHDAMQGAQRGLDAGHLKPSLVQVFPRFKPDFSGIAAEVAAKDLQAVMVLGSGSAVQAAVKAIRQAGSRAQVLALSNTASGGFVKGLGPDARGVMVTQVFPSERGLGVPMVRQASELLHAKKPAAALTPAMLEGFAAAKVLVEALQRAGRNPTRDGVQHALETMSHFDLGGLAVGYGPADHTGLELSDLSIVGADGRFQR